MLKVKSGVRPRSLWIAVAVANVIELERLPDGLITSGNDSQHMTGSKHYSDNALDFRTKHMSAEQKQTLVERLTRRLGPAYQVILESVGTETEHLHVEFDPVP